MKCMNCGGPVPPEFKSAIKNNLCPGCGKEIMNEATLDLLDEIKSALEEMPNDPEGLAGWLLSNYEMRKVGSAEPVNQFYGTPPQRKNSYDNFEQPGNLKMANNAIHNFYQNAGVKPPFGRQNNAAALVQSIQESNEADLDTPQTQEDIEYERAALAAMTGFSKTAIPTGSLPTADYENMLGASYTSEYDPALPEALNMDRMNRIKKQQEVSSGAKVGFIQRKK